MLLIVPLKSSVVRTAILDENSGILKPGGFLQELLKETRQEWAIRVVELLYSIFCLDTQQITLTLLGTIVPNLLTDSAHWHSLTDPPGKALAK